ncbi:MAG: right-handed parallel beta-helix repeat-containing protein [Ginsengibacter sp.]
MKKIILIVSVLFTLSANAIDYYVSASGNDSNNGTSTSTPWKTLNKVNSASLQAGDRVLFKRGDTFYGKIKDPLKGRSGSPITFGAYGSGDKPVITGFTTVSSWTNKGSNIWESTDAVSTLPDLNMVLVNGVNTPMGRYPNGDASYPFLPNFYKFQSVTGGAGEPSSITSNSLNNGVNWTGAEIVVRVTQWLLDRAKITGQTGNTIHFVNRTPGDPLEPNWGFFIQNDIRTLDQQNEWYYNPSTKRISIYSNGMPSNVQVATIDTLFDSHNNKTNEIAHVIVEDLSFIGANRTALSFNGNGNKNIPIVKNNSIKYAGEHGIQTSGLSYALIEHNSVSNAGGSGIWLANGEKLMIRNNHVHMTGVISVMEFGGFGGSGIFTFSKTPKTIIQYNRIDSSDNNGIHFAGDSVKILNNFITNSSLIKGDAGGIYSFGFGQKGRLIDGNIVLNGIGFPRGTPDNSYYAFGIYTDVCDDVKITNNTVIGQSASGVVLRIANKIIFENNTVYDGGRGNWANASLFLQGDGGEFSGWTKNNVVKNNILFARNSDQYPLKFYGQDANRVSSFGIIDSNYYVKPLSTSQVVVNLDDLSKRKIQTLSEWRSYSGKDYFTQPSPKSITNLDDIRVEYNASNDSKVVNLGASYVDAKGNRYNGSVTIEPWRSVILIYDGPAIQSPTFTAGEEQVIELPTNNVTLTGKITSGAENVQSVLWIKKSGGKATIENSSIISTSVTDLEEGVYVFELKITDIKGVTATDTVKVTVNAASNKAPTANAGADKTITLPTNNVTLTGSGSDEDGTITNYLWTKKSGPSAFEIVNATSSTTEVTGLTEGIYVFELKVTDNKGATATSSIKVTVNAASNKAPTANAGADKTITLPTSNVTLTGSGSDEDGTISNYLWTKKSGPSDFKIVNAASATTEVTGLSEVIYVFELKVTDNKGATATSSVKVTVNAAPNKAPTANAGGDKTITLPTNSVILTGSGSDEDGTITNYLWTKKSGPSAFQFVNDASPVTEVTGLTEGMYVFEIKVTDNKGATATSSVKVTVYAGNELNESPIADAGNDMTITDPISQVTLSGKAKIISGQLKSIEWRQISGPKAARIESSNKYVTKVSDLIAGNYEFELIIMDDKNRVGRDSVKVIVALGKLSKEVESNSFKVYPNPVRNLATLEINSVKVNEALTIIVSDLNGRIMMKKTITSSDYNFQDKMNLSNLTKGVYIITILFNEADKKTQKIIKM